MTPYRPAAVTSRKSREKTSPLRLKGNNMALPLAFSTYRREERRLVLVVGDELVAPLVLSFTLGVVSRGPVGSEHPPS
jgi:hypothetical protein